jgi:hypothetical protein
MGLVDAPEPFAKLIKVSHIPDKSVLPVNEAYHAVGWFASKDGSVIKHSGGNPSFTTHIVLFMEQGSGFCILANAASINMDGLVVNVGGIINGKEAQTYQNGGLQVVDMDSQHLISTGCNCGRPHAYLDY